MFSGVENGIGISKEDQAHIFTIFNGVKDQDNSDGTGIGLARVEKIVILHNTLSGLIHRKE